MTQRLILLAALIAHACAGLAAAQADYALPGDGASGVSAGSQELPAIARGADGWLVVWEDDRSSLGGFVQAPSGLHANSDIYAARLDAGGNVIDAVPIVVNQDPFDQVKPRVAWNGQHWLVVWQSARPTQFYVTKGIYAARVAADGSVLDDPPILIEDGDDFDERDPNVASDGTNWLVVYNQYVQGALAETLDGALVHPQGFVMQKQTVVPGSQFNQPVNVDIEFAVDRYLIAYEKGSNGVHGRLVGADLAAIGGETTLTTLGSKPEVASNGGSFFVSWSNARGTPVSLAGVPAIPGGASYLGSGPIYGPETDCAWDGTQWVVTFSSLSVGGGPAYLSATRVSPAGVLVSATPSVIAATNASLRAFAVGSGADRAQFVWDDWSLSSSIWQGGDLGDVWGAQMTPDGTASARSAVTTSGAAQVSPVLAGSASAGWLVGFLRLTSGVTQVCAQRLSPSGAPSDSEPTVLATVDRRTRRMDVAFDGQHWLVVWDGNTGAERRTFGRRVALDGSLPDAAPIDYLRGERPSVGASEHGDFLIASWDHNQSTEYIRALRVHGADGAALDTPYLTLSVGSGFPDVLGFDDRWVVAWGGVTGCFVDETGGVGAPFYFAQGASETAHGLARDGDLGLLAFRNSTSTSANGDVHVRRFQKDGTLLDTNLGIPVCQANRLQFDPRAAFDGTNFRVTWTDYRAHSLLEPGLGDLYEAVVAPDGTVQQVCGTARFADVRIPEGDAEIAADAGVVVIAANVLHPEAPRGGMRVHVAADAAVLGGTVYCPGDGSGTACPCGNTSPVGAGEGCTNSFGLGARLRAGGWASLGADSLVLDGSQMPDSSALYFQGTNQQNGGLGVALGDGLRCAGGVVVRLGTKTNAGGTSRYPGPGDAAISVRGGVLAPGVRTYQVWYRNAAGFCLPTSFNLTNGIEVVWSL